VGNLHAVPGRHLSGATSPGDTITEIHASRLPSEWRFPGYAASVRDRRRARSRAALRERYVWDPSPDEVVAPNLPAPEYVRQSRVQEHGSVDSRRAIDQVHIPRPAIPAHTGQCSREMRFGSRSKSSRLLHASRAPTPDCLFRIESVSPFRESPKRRRSPDNLLQQEHPPIGPPLFSSCRYFLWALAISCVMR